MAKLMKRWLFLALCFCIGSTVIAQKKEDHRLQESYDVLRDVLNTPDKGIPHNLLNKAKCVIVVPSMKKGAFHCRGKLRTRRHGVPQR